jgi:multidrug resistance protein MdtO
VDLLAAFRHFDEFKPADAPRLRVLAEHIARLERKLHSHSNENVAPLDCSAEGPLILLGLEHTADLLRMSLAPEPGQAFSLDLATPAAPPVFKPDLFTNSEHLQFALRGCLASVLCYFLFNAVFWPRLSPSLFTCVVTALTSIGSSRQKQLLRTSGAILGGLVVGMGSQVLILPMLDTISGFTALFVTVTLVASWFITASPRLSYFGTQFALAFYLIQLRGPSPQTNLAIARDNVMGILLGLVMMWLVFETLGSKPAVQVMRELFAENLGAMAQLANSWPEGRQADLQRIRTLREKISQNFAAVNSQADAVLFEVGRSRDRSLALRERLLNWQPRLRAIFLLEVALLQYRLQIEHRKLPPPILSASMWFDRELCALMEDMARVFRREVRVCEPAELEASYANLERAVSEAYAGAPAARARAVLAIGGQIIAVALGLLREMEEGI